MKKQVYSAVTIALLALSFQNCAPMKATDGQVSSPSKEGQQVIPNPQQPPIISDEQLAKCQIVLLESFQKTTYPFLVTNCSACHSSGPGNGFFASEDSAAAFEAYTKKGDTKIFAFAIGSHKQPFTGPQHTASIESLKAEATRRDLAYKACLSARPTTTTSSSSTSTSSTTSTTLPPGSPIPPPKPTTTTGTPTTTSSTTTTTMMPTPPASPSVGTIGIGTLQQSYASLASALQVAVPSASSKALYRIQVVHLSASGKAESIGPSALLAHTSLAGELCRDRVNLEVSGPSLLFSGINLSGAPSAIGNSALKSVINRLARSLWARNETAEEQAVLLKLVNDLVNQSSAADGKATQDIMVGLCSAIASSASGMQM
ncbi:MAG: hypothetical protein K2X47_03905 [Bdellovibrionales bacterium]|nr:hypothetical protein [Bdellovibrionales bacterium]